MTDGRRGDRTDISALFGVLRRRGFIILVAVIVAGAVGYIYSKGKDTKYEASATLILRGAPPGTPTAPQFGTPTPDTAPDREALILSRRVKSRFIKATRSKLGGSNAAAKAFDDAKAVSGSESTSVEITATASNGSAAALIANTIADQNIAERRESALTKIRRAQRVAQRELRKLGTNPQQAAAASVLRQNILSLNQSAGNQDGDADVLERASAPSSPASPKPTRDGLIGAFAGLLLGLAIALVREQLDRRLKGVGELSSSFGLPVLANVPASRALTVKSGAKPGKALDDLPGAEQEAFQMLRANLRFLNTDRELRSVVVTSPGVGDGKSTVALNLAKADASAGGRVLLIEADMRRPSIGKLLGLDGVSGGLATYLANADTRLDDVVRSVTVASRTNGTGAPVTMDVLVAGSIPGNPSELVNSDRMLELIGEAEGKYGLVIIDTSPAGIVADAIPLMSRASAVVVVGRVGRLTSGDASDLREQLERINAPAYGLVANFSGDTAKGYGYYT